MRTPHAVLAFLLMSALVACQSPNAGTGSLTISIPSPRTVTQNSGKGDLVRIQLVRNGTTVPLSGKSYLEQGLAGQTTTLDGLPSGTGYTLNVASGELKSTFFEVGYFQASEAFEISAGVDTKVTVTLEPTPLRLLNAGSDSRHSAVAYLNGGREHLRLVGSGPTGATTHFDLAAEVDATTVSALVPDLGGVGWPAGATLRSLGLSVDPVTQESGVFYNTDKGIGFVSGAKFDFTMKDPLGAPFDPVPVVDLSGSFQVVATNPLDSSIDITTLNVYSGPNLTAALAINHTGDTGGILWNDLVKTMDVDSILDSIGVDSNNVDRLVNDFSTTKDWAYISTAMSTYRVDGTMLQGDVQGLSDKFTNGADDVVVKVSLNGNTVPIDSISAYEGATEGLVYAGTSKGLFSAPTNLVGLPTADLKLVSGTFGLKIARLASRGFGSEVFTAAYASNSNEVLIVDGNNQVVTRIPRLQGLPSGDLELIWWVDTSANALKLVISGDDGSVVYTAR